MEERRCSGGREGVAAVVVVARFQISRRLDAGRSWTHYSVESLCRSIVKDLEDEVSEGKEKKGKKKKCALHEDEVGGRETFVIALVPLERGKEGITGNGVVGVELRLSIGSRS